MVHVGWFEWQLKSIKLCVESYYVRLIIIVDWLKPKIECHFILWWGRLRVNINFQCINTVMLTLTICWLKSISEILLGYFFCHGLNNPIETSLVNCHFQTLCSVNVDYIIWVGLTSYVDHRRNCFSHLPSIKWGAIFFLATFTTCQMFILWNTCP